MIVSGGFVPRPYNSWMRRSWLNLALVGVAGSMALVLTVVRKSPEGTMSLELDAKAVHAAPGETGAPHHDLSALVLFNKTLLKVKDRYVDPSRIDPKKMLYSALDSVQFNIPEVLVEPDVAHNKVTVAVNDKREVFETDDVDSLWRMTAKLKRVFRFVETNMNAGADLAKVEYAAINGMLNTLDPHSTLMDPESARDMDVSTSGKFGGLGIVIKMTDRKLMVIKPMKDTPASHKGIKAGDHIVRINSDETENLTSNEAVDRMRGEPRSGVTLWIERKGEPNLLRFDLVRELIRVSVVQHKLLDKGVGYIQVKQFSKNIAADVSDAMKEMIAKGATSWILDLRYNPGGLLEEAVQLADLFVDSGTIVSTVSGRERDARRAERGFGDSNNSLAVLVNGGSASASEIVAGALKNLDRAAIIGTRTFGKGSVQELYDNEDKSKLKLTIAQYLTPGDRSIQNLGIVPDIQLQRMYIPEKNDAPSDFVRMLSPTRTYGEKDLDAHLISTYAKDIDKPSYELPFLVEKKQPATGTPAVTQPPDDEDGPDEDEVVEDFEIKFARDLVSSVSSPNRQKLVAGATKLVAKVRADEEKKLIAALATVGVDWSAPAAGEQANLDIALTTSPAGTVKAGATVSVTATVKNTGTGAAYRVLPRVHADDGSFEDTELPIGKVGPGETKTYTTQIAVPKEASDRFDRLSLEVRAPNAQFHVTPAEIHVEATPRPVFAYSYQLVDDSNGDGLIQRGEKFRLAVQVRNIGPGKSDKATVYLRNATGDGVTLGKSRFEEPDLLPEQVRELEFPLTTDSALHGDEVIVELMVYDEALDVQTSQKLKFKIAPSVIGAISHAAVTTKTTIAVHTGASDDSTILGTAPKGTSYQAIGNYGPYTKVVFPNKKLGFIPSQALTQSGNGGGTYIPMWNSSPPLINWQVAKLETSDDHYRLQGVVSDEQHVEDVYIYVSNRSSKIDSHKVFYRSNRGGKNAKALDFAADLPLWAGSNLVTVVARENAETRSIRTLFIYREPPRTAQAP